MISQVRNRSVNGFNRQENRPPASDLIQLIKLTQPILNEQQQTFLVTLNTLSITTRYPDDLGRALKEFNQGIADSYIDMTEEVIECLKKDTRLSK